MLHGRNAGGVVMWQGDAYVFGSCRGSGVSTGESIALPQGQWRSLPNMHKPRFSFTPTIWRNSIYLCGGWECDSAEVFDGISMRLLTLKLPETGRTLSCLHGSSLLLFTYNYLTVLSLHADSDEVQVTSKQHSKYYPDSNTSPVLRGDLFFFHFGKVCRCSAEDGEPLISSFSSYSPHNTK